MVDKILNAGWQIAMPFVKNYYRLIHNCEFGRKSYISYKSKLGGHNHIGRNTYIPGTIMGYGSYISDDGYWFDAKIGKYTCIGQRTATICGQHPTRDFVSVHPAFFSNEKRCGLSYVRTQKYKEFNFTKSGWSVIVGNDVWIGSDVKIMEGVTIGNGAVIAAGAIVLKDVEPYAIVAGVPAKVIRYRFEPEDVKWLESLQWWNQSEEWIRNHAEYFSQIEQLKEKVNEE